MKHNLLLMAALTMLVVFASQILAEPAQATVKCSCLTINADGEGSTSCSTSESGGRCTIDYNLFNEREDRAVEVLGKYLDAEFTSYRELDVREALTHALQREEIVEQVQLYLSIAAVDQFVSHEGTIKLDYLQDVWQRVNQHMDEVIAAFDPRGHSEELTLLVDRDDVVITFGCISVETPDIRVMFKTWTSPARAIPHCKGDDL
ncbi:MAG: hypothetical protein OXM01_11470 [Gemmatimonadota bacterium]|nr:hypothetical protein [Gemmatimonadota bacterium]